VAVNLMLLRMLGRERPELLGQSFLQLVHPGDRERDVAAYRALAEGRSDRLAVESRLARGDGGTLWCAQVAGVVRDAGGHPESFVTIVEDVTERRSQAERAIHIQRQLLPQATPVIQGYDLAGACRPAQDVAGDFYDWVTSADGCIDVTVADVMGKGMGAALVMAVLRTALRSAPASLGPAARVRVAADSLARGLSDEGLFITLFHGRLDVASGILHYVDAGHGYCAIRQDGGHLVPLSRRSLPVGVRSEEVFDEGTVRLDPGDMLIVYSDGLVEREEETVPLSELDVALDGVAGAGQMVRRLMRWVPARPADDVTVVVLSRLAAERAHEAAVAAPVAVPAGGR
jgi:PAS domain S-box-containing protein